MAILLLIITGGVAWCYRSAFIAGTIKFATAESGTITHERKVQATFANQELLVISPLSGNVEYLGEDGQRVRRGDPIAAVQSVQSQTIAAAMSGLFIHKSDGLEPIITSENLLTMDLTKLLSQSANVKVSGDTVQTGDALGKIVNNLVPTVAFLEMPTVDGLIVGKTLRLKIGEQTLTAKIMRKSEEPRGVVAQFSNYVDGTAEQRRQEVTWIYRSPTSGVLIPKSALWTKGEELGVFLWSEGVVQFKKVKVLDENEDKACIEDLPNGIPVVITPRDGLEGLVPNPKKI
ncbi:HlyD family efflux transporter periplasmic adaptor subunit [Desulfosporosinus orientis]|uniref:HlyD family efflux transporter periplasmic adaptor subunit n=1 Tax=Desulfosporosinus orientis TaxID=1563 RepID=UPI001FA78DFF